jgi:hypothetical protein
MLRVDVLWYFRTRSIRTQQAGRVRSCQPQMLCVGRRPPVFCLSGLVGLSCFYKWKGRGGREEKRRG